jgi:hypothetical protein
MNIYVSNVTTTVDLTANLTLTAINIDFTAASDEE